MDSKLGNNTVDSKKSGNALKSYSPYRKETGQNIPKFYSNPKSICNMNDFIDNLEKFSYIKAEIKCSNIKNTAIIHAKGNT